MADVNTSEKAPERDVVSPDTLAASDGEPQRPSGWLYKSFRIGPIYIPWYASPRIQLGMIAFVCFMCPGMFNALSGLGGGGKKDATLADNMVSYRANQFIIITANKCS